MSEIHIRILTSARASLDKQESRAEHTRVVQNTAMTPLFLYLAVFIRAFIYLALIKYFVCFANKLRIVCRIASVREHAPSESTNRWIQNDVSLPVIVTHLLN